MIQAKHWVLAATTAGTFLLLLINLSSDTARSALPSGLGSLGRHDVFEARLTRANHLWEQDVKARESMIAAAGYDRAFPDGYISPYNVWDFARPSYTCPHDLERVGKLGDGGKYVCGMLSYEAVAPGPAAADSGPELIVYSFGINDDSSFEAALLERTNARIWGYDMTVEGWAPEVRDGNKTEFAKFHKMALDKTTHLDAVPARSTVQDLMKANGHDYIDIMKMDIEGAEFDVLTSWIEAVRRDNVDGSAPVLPVGQLLIELHIDASPPPTYKVPMNLKDWTTWWSALESTGLRPANNEDNWLGDVGSGRPHYMEYTMINAKDRKRNKLMRALQS